jgi:hypothetical protein
MITERMDGTTAGRDVAPAPPDAVAQRGKVNVSGSERAASTVIGGVPISGFVGRWRSAGDAALALLWEMIRPFARARRQSRQRAAA